MPLPALTRVQMADGDYTRWLVESAKHAGAVYTVDLLDFPTPFGPNGSCTCPNFTIRLQPKLERGEVPEGCWLRCKHCGWARDAYADAMLMVEYNRRNP